MDPLRLIEITRSMVASRVRDTARKDAFDARASGEEREETDGS